MAVAFWCAIALSSIRFAVDDAAAGRWPSAALGVLVAAWGMVNAHRWAVDGLEAAS